jgi:hypothetical protein
MSAALRTLITELRQGAELSLEGVTAVAWRRRIKALPSISITAHGPAVFVIAGGARNILLQRGETGPHSDAALCGVVAELANILELELTAQESRRKNRNDDRREVPWHLRSDA